MKTNAIKLLNIFEYQLFLWRNIIYQFTSQAFAIAVLIVSYAQSLNILYHRWN